jgi:hypothetical protein
LIFLVNLLQLAVCPTCEIICGFFFSNVNIPSYVILWGSRMGIQLRKHFDQQFFRQIKMRTRRMTVPNKIK